MNLDRTLAFTALLEQDPPFRHLSLDEAGRRIGALLQDWYAEEAEKEPSLWDYASKWLARERTGRIKVQYGCEPVTYTLDELAQIAFAFGNEKILDLIMALRAGATLDVPAKAEIAWMLEDHQDNLILPKFQVRNYNIWKEA